MKYISTLIVALIILSVQTSYGQSDSKESNEELYRYKLKVIKSTQLIITSVVKELKENHFEKNKQAKLLVSNALLALKEANQYKVKYLQYAKEKKWKAALLEADDYWHKQILSADKLYRAKALLEK